MQLYGVCEDMIVSDCIVCVGGGGDSVSVYNRYSNHPRYKRTVCTCNVDDFHK